MKKALILLLLTFSISSFAQKIEWTNIEEAEKIQKENPNKPLFIDIYTDWCGWCKKMDSYTFLDKAVIQKINENYIPVKLDAEQKKDITFKGHKFTYVSAGSRGVNTLAYHLLRGEMSFPSYVVLNSEGKIINTLNGYFEPDALLQNL